MIAFKQSPNFHKGRFAPITHLVLHAMVGYYQPSINLFLKPGSNVSAHYCVSKKGEIFQLVKEEDTAYHVCQANTFTVGIELEDQTMCLKNGSWIVPKLLSTSITLAAQICIRHNIPIENIIQHQDPFLRKFGNNHSDCGKFFDSKAFQALVSAEILKIHPVKKLMLQAPSLWHPTTIPGPVPMYPRSYCPGLDL